MRLKMIESFVGPTNEMVGPLKKLWSCAIGYGFEQQGDGFVQFNVP